MNRNVGLWLVWFVLSWTFGFGQATTGTFLGTVTDSSGAVLPGATLLIKNLDTGITRTVQSDEAGRYSARALTIGNYEISASLVGFQSTVHSRLTLTLGQEAVVNFQLPVGAVTETVEVAGEAPLVETTQSSVDFLVNGTNILPSIRCRMEDRSDQESPSTIFPRNLQLGTTSGRAESTTRFPQMIRCSAG